MIDLIQETEVPKLIRKKASAVFLNPAKECVIPKVEVAVGSMIFVTWNSFIISKAYFLGFAQVLRIAGLREFPSCSRQYYEPHLVK